MSMEKRWKVSFTVYEDDSCLTGDSDLRNITTVVTAFMPQQAQAMVEAQYGKGRTQIHSVFPD